MEFLFLRPDVFLLPVSEEGPGQEEVVVVAAAPGASWAAARQRYLWALGLTNRLHLWVAFRRLSDRVVFWRPPALVPADLHWQQEYAP